MAIPFDGLERDKNFSEEFFCNIFLQAGDGIFLINEQSCMVEMNPRGCEILGYSREELLGQPVLSFQPEDEIAHILEKLSKLAVEKLVVTESVFLRKDGTRIPVEITGKLLSDNHIIGLLRDISERKQSERVLRESEEKFRSLVEQSPDGIFMADEYGAIVEWNHGQENVSGLMREEVLGKPVWDIQWNLMPEEFRTEENLERLKSMFKGILASGSGSGLNLPRETIFQLADGVYRNVEVMMYTNKTNAGYRIGGIVRDSTERKQAEQRLEYLAMHDVLTDLPNRQLFLDRLHLALSRTRREAHGLTAVMLLDLDNFKEVNDQFGHDFGDQLLKIVARRLQTCLRKSDTAARMGGDEFTLIVEDITDWASCNLIAQKVLDTLSQVMEIEGRRVWVTASIGISLLTPENEDAATLLRRADIAMYAAKKLHNTYRFFESTIKPSSQTLVDCQPSSGL
jgi:diguanylate cyclase (GGDEF)-like protein/PAS domain S-box-containing protein